jgi:hypothetical protein
MGNIVSLDEYRFNKKVAEFTEEDWANAYEELADLETEEN